MTSTIRNSSSINNASNKNQRERTELSDFKSTANKYALPKVKNPFFEKNKNSTLLWWDLNDELKHAVQD